MGHGHVRPNPNGMVARCGGPALCKECALELARETIDIKSVMQLASDACNAHPSGLAMVQLPSHAVRLLLAEITHLRSINALLREGA